MNKGDLAAAVADKTGMSKASASQAVEAVFGCITDSLKKGQEVRVLGFGNFTVSKRAASTGRNPQTGAVIKIAARKVAKFTPGVELKKAVNKK